MVSGSNKKMSPDERRVKKNLEHIGIGGFIGLDDAYFERDYTHSVQCKSDVGEIYEIRSEEFFWFLQGVQGG